MFPSLWLSKILFLMVTVVPAHQVWAAACCGGGSSSASLISSDHRAILGTSYSYFQTVIDHVDGAGLWMPASDTQSTETLKVDYSHTWMDRFQTGISLPFVNRKRAGQNQSGLGDVAITQGYEYLPDWDYNPWRPQGIGFLQLTVPTGTSIQEADDFYKLSSRGRGFWSLGLGTLLSKNWRAWDASAQVEIHKSFSKHVNNDSFQGVLIPGWGESLNLGAGFNFRDYRVGSSLGLFYEDPVRTQSDRYANESQDAILQRYVTASMSFSYMPVEDWGFILTYSDQTLFGSPVNTSLGRSMTFLAQKKWAR